MRSLDHYLRSMLNALHVFHGVVNDPSFRDTPFLVFLNKKDLFEQKLKAGTMIKAVPSFKDYKGGTSVSAGIKYFTKKFEKTKKIGQHALLVNKQLLQL